MKRILVLSIAVPLMALVNLIHRTAFFVDRLIFRGLESSPVRGPVFVVGSPRSGTTLMHRLLAENRSSLTTMPLWELIFAPALSEKYFLAALYRLDALFGGPAIRLILWCEKKFTRSLSGVHTTSLFLPEEDYLGLLPFGGCFLKVLMFPHRESVWRLGHFESALDEPERHRLTSIYRGLVIRHLRYRGDQFRLLSKNPCFTSWVPALLKEFPDASFIATVRSPVEVVASQLSSIREGLAVFGNTPADPSIRDRFTGLLLEYFRQVCELHQNVPKGQYCLVDYEAMKLDPAGVVLSCQGLLGIPLTDSDRNELRKKSDVAKEYRSDHRYSLDEFDLVPEKIHVDFGEYFDSALKQCESDGEFLSEWRADRGCKDNSKRCFEESC